MIIPFSSLYEIQSTVEFSTNQQLNLYKLSITLSNGKLENYLDKKHKT